MTSTTCAFGGRCASAWSIDDRHSLLVTACRSSSTTTSSPSDRAGAVQEFVDGDLDGAARHAEPSQRTTSEPRPHPIGRRRDVPPQQSRIVVAGVQHDPGQRRVEARAPVAHRGRLAVAGRSRDERQRRRRGRRRAPDEPAADRPRVTRRSASRAWPRRAGEECRYPVRAWSSLPSLRPSVAARAPGGYPRGSERPAWPRIGASARQAPSRAGCDARCLTASDLIASSNGARVDSEGAARSRAQPASVAVASSGTSTSTNPTSGRAGAPASRANR